MGAHGVQINLEPASNARNFAESHTGPASEVMPDWAERILNH